MIPVFSVRAKLLLLILTPLVLITILALLANQRLEQVSKAVNTVSEERLLPIRQLNNISNLYNSGIVDLSHKSRAQMLLWSEASTQLEQTITQLDDEWQAYKTRPLLPQEQKLLEEGKVAFESATKTIEKLRGFVAEQSSYSLGNFIDLQLYPGLEPLQQLVKSLAELQINQANLAAKNANQLADTSQVIVLGLLLAIATLVLGIGFWLYRGISKPLNLMLDTVTEIESKCDLTLRANISQKDEFGDMGRRFDRMLDSICAFMHNLQGTCEHAESVSKQMLEINDETVKRSQQQNAEIAEMTKSMVKVNESAITVLHDVKQSEQSIMDAEKVSQEGSESVQETIDCIETLSSEVTASVNSIQLLKTHSDKIGGVLDVIKGIAEQTNLLALNAAIEAARAGDQGRGFAVVADEVRQLASRTAASTQEIQDIILSLQNGTVKSADQMEHGKETAQKSVIAARNAGDVLEKVEAVFQNILDNSQGIANIAEQQLVVAEGVEQQVLTVGELTKDTLSLTTHAADTGQQVAQISETLRASLAQFKTH